MDVFKENTGQKKGSRRISRNEAICRYIKNLVYEDRVSDPSITENRNHEGNPQGGHMSITKCREEGKIIGVSAKYIPQD